MPIPSSFSLQKEIEAIPIVDFVDFTMYNPANLTSGRTARGHAHSYGEGYKTGLSVIILSPIIEYNRQKKSYSNSSKDFGSGGLRRNIV
jgi:hypothetical protein